MDAVRAITSQALALRKAERLRVRLPLGTLSIITPNPAAIEPFEAILRDELNVKRIEIAPLEEDSASNLGIERSLVVHARQAGPRLGKRVQEAIKAAKSGDWTEENGVVTAGRIQLQEGEYDLALVTGDASTDRALALMPDGGILLLDTQVTPELEAEGLARDVIRLVQEARREAGLDVSDRIRLTLRLDDATACLLYTSPSPRDS